MVESCAGSVALAGRVLPLPVALPAGVLAAKARQAAERLALGEAALAAAWPGHADISFTMRTYIHAQADMLELAARSFAAR